MYDKEMLGMFGNVRKGMYDFAAPGSGRDRVGRDRRFPPHGWTVCRYIRYISCRTTTRHFSPRLTVSCSPITVTIRQLEVMLKYW